MFEHLLRLPPGPVDLTAIDPDGTPGFDGRKADGKAALAALGEDLADLQERLFAEGVADAVTAVGAARPAGHGHLGQGRRAAAHRRPGRPAGRADHLASRRPPTRSASTTSCGASAGPCRARPHRRLRPLALRGRPDRPGPRARRRRRRSSGATTRSTSSRPSCSRPARRSSSACCTSRPRSSGPGCWPGSTTPQALEVQPRRHRRARAAGRTTARPTRSRWSAPTPRSRRGTSIPADRKWYRNLAVGQMLHDTLARMAPSWPAADFDVEEQKGRLSTRARSDDRPRSSVTRYVTPAARGRQPARDRGGRRPRHLRLQVPRRRPGRPGAGRRGRGR